MPLIQFLSPFLLLREACLLWKAGQIQIHLLIFEPEYLYRILEDQVKLFVYVFSSKETNYIIENFKNRLEEFNSLEGKVSDKKILFLAALKAEDNFLELKNNSNKSLNENSVKEIIKLKDYIEKIEEKNIKLEKTNKEISNEINEIDKKISFLINKILEKDEKNN